MRGNTGNAPLKTLDEEALSAGVRRFRFLPLKQRLDAASARPAALPSNPYSLNLQGVHPDDTSFSHFSAALTTNAEINITSTFVQYLEQVKPLSLSLPLLFRNRRTVLSKSLHFLRLSTHNAAEATVSIASCIAALAKDLGAAQFQPFFPQIVAAFADVFTTAQQLRTQKNLRQSHADKTTSKPAHSVMWDPQASMIPLFSALAQITKSHIQLLASYPRQTILDLRPLLSNAHYRIREMTTESCLGYLLRKTRDPDALKSLVVSLLDVAHENSEDAMYIDGLGITLFEAVRLPSGLHMRATQALTIALQHLAQLCQNMSSPPTDRPSGAFVLVARCFASLCRHVKSQTDIQNMFVLLVTEIESALRTKNATQTAHLCFIARKCLVFTKDAVRNQLGLPHLQRMLHVLSTCVDQYVDDPRVVSEAFRACLYVVSRAPPSFRRKAVSLSIKPSMGFMAGSSSANAIVAVLSSLRNIEYGNKDMQSPNIISEGVAALCEQLANISSNKIQVGDGEDVSVSEDALKNALCFVQYAKMVDKSDGYGYKPIQSFKVPTLSQQVKSLLLATKSISVNKESQKSHSEMVHLALEYIRTVRIPDMGDVFANLFHLDNLSLSDSSRLLDAFVCQIDEGRADVASSVFEKANQIVQETLRELETVAIPVDVLRPLDRFFKRHPQNSNQILIEVGATALLTKRLSEYLSFSDDAVRKGSAALLKSLCQASAPEATAESDEDQMLTDEEIRKKEDQQLLEGLRYSFTNQDALHGLYNAFSTMFHVQRTMNRIDFVNHLLFELIRLVETSVSLNHSVLLATVHFCIGLFRTQFKLFWQNAANLWCTVAAHDESLAMTVLMRHIDEVEKSLVLRWQGDDLDDIEIDENDADLQDENIDDAPSKAAGSTKPNGRGSKRRRGSQNDAEREGTRHVSKKQRAQDREKGALQWDSDEWKTFSNEKSLDTIRVFSSPSSSSVRNSTDDISFIQELLRTLMKEPKYTVSFRRRIVACYLTLYPSRFPRRTGDAITICFVQLLEKMGGLKCSEDDKSLESALRSRLSADICRPCPALQTASLRCLCIARSPYLKPHRDSLIRLIGESSFREELAALTNSLFTDAVAVSSNDTELGEQEEPVVDILIRVCYSKMRGKRAKMDSRRAAVLSFITSKLPWSIAIPKLTNLALEPFQVCIEEVETQDSSVMNSTQPIPAVNVQRGMLGSLESILHQCKRAIPLETWQKMGFASFILLSRAGSGSVAQDLRSRCLRLTAKMVRIRPVDSAVFISPIVRAVRAASFSTTDVNMGQKSPAFLHFMASVFGCDLPEQQMDLLLSHLWAATWCLDVTKNSGNLLSTVELCVEFIRGLLKRLGSMAPTLSEQGKDSNAALYSDLTNKVASALQVLLQKLVTFMSADRSKHRTWSGVFSQSLELVEALSRSSSLSGDVLITSAETLSTFVISSSNVTPVIASALRAYAAVARRICEQKPQRTEDSTNDDHVKRIRQLTREYILLLSNRAFIGHVESYSALCDVLRSVDLDDLDTAATYLKNLNAMNASRLSEPDLDCRIDTLNRVIACLKSALSVDDTDSSTEVLPVNKNLSLPRGTEDSSETVEFGIDAMTALFYGCFASINHDDSAVRGTSSFSLELMAKWASRADSDTAADLHHTMNSVLMEAVTNCKSTVLRREYSKSFGTIVRGTRTVDEKDDCPENSILITLRNLMKSRDVNSDVFENIAHLQHHRRTRALRRLEREVLSAKTEDEMSSAEKESVRIFASKFSLPLGTQIALEVFNKDDAKNYGRFARKEEARGQAERNVIFWAISLVGASARWLVWKQYKSQLLAVLSKLKNEDSEERTHILYQLLVALVEAFPNRDKWADTNETEVRKFLTKVLLPKMLFHVSAGAVEGNILNPDDYIARQNGSHHKEKTSPTIFRAPIAICIGKLMAKLPEAELETTIPLLVTPLSNALRSRMSDTRDSAKKALTTVALLLGSKYFSYIIQQVLSALSQGFRKDGCVHVIYALLSGIDNQSNAKSDEHDKRFKIDGAATTIAEYLADELESGTLVTKNDFEDPNASTNRQKQASSRAMKANECAELLAKYISFEESGLPIFLPFEKLLRRSSSTKLRSRIDEVLTRVIQGFSGNKTFSASYALKLSYKLMSRTWNEESKESAKTATNAASPDNTPVVPNLTIGVDDRIISFGLQLLHNVLGMNSTPFEDTSMQQAMLQPFLPMIAEVLTMNQDMLTLSALKASQKLLKMPFPSSKKAELEEKISEIIENVLSQGAGAFSNASGIVTTSELFDICLRCAAFLLQESSSNSKPEIPRERVEALVTISMDCIESGSLDSRSAALSLLRAIASSGIVVPVVYDAMEKVMKMTIVAQSSSLRSSCAALSVKLLTSLPFTHEKLRHHMQYFIRNLNFKLVHGRYAALTVIKEIIMKFPWDFLEDHSEYLFISLAACAARDTETECRALATKVIQALFERLSSGRKTSDFIRMSSRLMGVKYEAGNIDTLCCDTLSEDAVFLSGIAGLRAACKSEWVTREQLNLISRVLLSSFCVLSDDTSWNVVYAILSCFEDLIAAQSTSSGSRTKIEVHPSTKPLWEKLSALLLHSHQWVRLSSARLLGNHLSTAGGRESVPCADESQFLIVWSKRGLVREILKSLCIQFEASELSEDLAQQSLKNILCLANIMFSHSHVGDVFSEDNEQDEQKGGKKRERTKAHEGSQNRGLQWLLSRISGLAVRVAKDEAGLLRRGCALRFLLVTTKWWGRKGIMGHRNAYITPIVQILESKDTLPSKTLRITEGDGSAAEEEPDSRGITVEDLKSLAQTLQEALIENIGSTEYFEIYHKLRTKLAEAKEERKRAASFLLATDPERAAKKRRKKAEARKKKKFDSSEHDERTSMQPAQRTEKLTDGL